MEGETVNMVTRQIQEQWSWPTGPSDPPQLSVCEEEVPPEQQERSSSLGQEEPEPLQIKEEQEEIWTSQEGEQLQGLEEADITVKSEHDEEKPQSSWLNQTQTEENKESEPLAGTSTEQMKTEPDGEDCGVSEPASNLDPAGDLEPTIDGQLLSSDCSGTKTDDSDEWEETGKPQSGLNTLKSKKTQKNKGQSLSISNKFKSSVGSSHEVKLSKQNLSKTWSCKVCGKCFPSRYYLTVHIRVHSSDCGLCGKHLEPTESLKLHLEAHRTCTVCGKRFAYRKYLEQHMESHAGEKPFSCTLCHKRFVQKGTLTKHLKSHSGEKLYSCSLCHKRFIHKYDLDRHLRSHTGEKPYSCTLCQKRFGHKSDLDRHVRNHTGEKPFSCTLCQKRFSYKPYLDRHLRSHTGEKPYRCTLCQKRFVLKENLNRHMRIHTGEKPYSCTLCRRRFGCKNHLDRHLRSHTGEKPFSCTVCGKGFTQKGHVERHMRIHAGEKTHSCLSLPLDSPQLSVCEEEVPPVQQERSPSLGQEEPEPLQIKEEQEEFWTSQEGEQLRGLEDADITVKSEHDEEKPQSSWFNQNQTEQNREAEPLASSSTEQLKTEPNGEDFGVSEPASNLDPAGDLEPTRDGQGISSDCSGSETDDSDEWEETGEPQSGFNTLKSKKTQKKGQSSCINNKFKSSVGPSHEVKLSNQILSESWRCEVCGKCFGSDDSLGCHVKVHRGDCGLCGKHLEPTESLKLHLQAHGTCTVCGKKFTKATDFERHMRSHTGEKPYSCTLCHKRFGHRQHLDIHLRSHTGEKPYSCALCNKRFGQRGHLNIHLRIHTGEKPFSCMLCGKGFTQKGHVERHMKIHAEEKTHPCLSLLLDPPQLSVCEEEVPPEQQERSPSLGQEEPEPLQIKEEQEELWTSQEREQLQILEEADIIKLTSTPVLVKNLHDEEKPQSSWFNQNQTKENREAEPLSNTSTEQIITEPFGEDCGVSEPASNLDPAGDLEPTRDGQLLSSHSSGTETEDSDEWEETGEPQSGLNILKSKKTQKNKGQSLSNSNKFKSSVGSSHEVKLPNQILSETWSCKVCGKCFPSRCSLGCHIRFHPSDCGLCGKHLEPTESLKLHIQTHRTCTVCGKKCTTATDLDRHMRSHTGEKPYSCTLCHKRFGQKGNLTLHLRSHTGEKPVAHCHEDLLKQKRPEWTIEQSYRGETI